MLFSAKHGRQREPSVKTLHSPHPVKVSRYYALSGGTQHIVLSTRAAKIEVLIEPC